MDPMVMTAQKYHPRMAAHSRYEAFYGSRGYTVIGVDEVGRGALAGPIAVGAVAFKMLRNGTDAAQLESLKLKDSKLLSPQQRQKASQVIGQNCVCNAVAYGSVDVINAKGIVFAFEQAAREAVSKVILNLDGSSPVFLLTDAFKVPHVRGVGQSMQLNIIKGDLQSVSIAAASIVAKVARDSLMCELALKYEPYRWESNKGYGTKDHIEAIKNHGSTELHRTLYLRKVLA